MTLRAPAASAPARAKRRRGVMGRRDGMGSASSPPFAAPRKRQMPGGAGEFGVE